VCTPDKAPSLRPSFRRVPARLALIVALAGAAHAQAALPGTDIRDWLTADISGKLSLAGTWIPIDTTAIIVGPYWSVIKLGASQREGVALGGWAWNNSFTSALPDTTPVRAALLEQQVDGTLVDASARLLGDAFTNGAGSIIAADFNGDGLDDLVLPAHNESPFIWKHSTAWISRPSGGLDRLTLADNVMNHDARLVVLDGKKKIFARSFGGSGVNGQGAGFNVLYSWSGNTLVADTSLGDLGGQSVLADRFAGNADDWLIIGDSRGGGPGGVYSETNPMLNYAYRYSAGAIVLPRVVLPKPYFNDKPAYAGFDSLWDPYSKTHTSRLWKTDLNQDGLPDILAGQELWSAGPAGLQKAVFQLLVNRGGMVFTDDTDALAPEFSQDSFIDYSIRFADVDGSGIDTMFHASHPVFYDTTDALKQGQYILVNDGTGRLYAAMHDEFRAMRVQIAAFLLPLIPGGGTPNTITPQFIAYRTAAGKLNFVAVVHYFMPNLSPQHRWAFINVPLGINLTTDFRRDLTVLTRNGSKRIRTFAGNDTIARALADPDCSIDGGLGTNTAVYPGPRNAWVVTKFSEKVTVRPVAGPGGTDTLTRIQSARFDDQTVDLGALPISGADNPLDTPAVVVEYFNAGLGHYFVSADPVEIQWLDGGALGGAWSRTGSSFKAWRTGAALAGSTPVCRFFGTDRYRANGSRIGPNSHFYTGDAAECAYVKSAWPSIASDGVAYPAWTFESNAFLVRPPFGGGCPALTQPLYRTYNNGANGDPNHRYATNASTLHAMAGWAFEGVVMCVSSQ